MTEAPPLRIRELVATLRKYYLLVLIPTIGLGVAAASYAVKKEKTWQATQTLTIRDEASGSTKGRFLDSESMQSAQETVLEIARSYQVVEAALVQAGPFDPAQASEQWPTRNAVEDLQSRIALTAPKGKEFGKTEIIYLSAKATSPDRAAKLTVAVGDQLVERLKEIRVTRARQSVIDELVRARELARGDLNTANSKLAEIETKLGPDLNELRMLNQSSSNSGHLTTAQIQIHTDWRGAKNRHLEVLEDRQHLQAALENPSHLAAGAPKRLLTEFPQLQRLSVGLAEAKLNKSQLLGKMTGLHPKVRAATLAEAKVQIELREELQTVLSGLENEIATYDKMAQTYKSQLDEINDRLQNISSLRLTYQNLEHQVKQRTQIVEQIVGDLASGRSSLSAARTTSLVQRMNQPVAGERPLGPGTAMIVAVGLAGGLLTGVGLVFLVAPFARRGRRTTDQVGGQRAADQTVGRRSADTHIPKPVTTTTAGNDRRQAEPVATEAATEAALSAVTAESAPEPLVSQTVPLHQVAATTNDTHGSDSDADDIDDCGEEELILTSSSELQMSASTAASTETTQQREHQQPTAPHKPLTLVESLSRIAAKE